MGSHTLNSNVYKKHVFPRPLFDHFCISVLFRSYITPFYRSSDTSPPQHCSDPSSLALFIVLVSASTMPYLRPTIVLIKHSHRRVRFKPRNHRSNSPRPPAPTKNMDPDCAICSQPALAQCECEAKGLDIAVRQAEQRMMTSVFNEIRYVSYCPPFPSPFLDQFQLDNGGETLT